MRVAACFLAGVVGSMTYSSTSANTLLKARYEDSLGDVAWDEGSCGNSAFNGVANCYNSVENAIQFRNDQTGKYGYKSAPGEEEDEEGYEVRRKRKVFSTRFQPYQLGEIIPITHDTALFRFLLPRNDDEFNLRPCSTLQACYKYGVQAMDQCQRFYTPVTANHTKGYFDIIVKRKQNGNMTNHLFGMHVGDKLLFRSVSFKIQYKPNKWNHVGMIAGGTGFTPMLQIIRHGLLEKWANEQTGKELKDKTKLSLLFCNRTENHILLKGLFDDLANKHASRFRVFYTIDQAVDPDSWKGWTGYVTEDMVRESMPKPGERDTIIMLCGPDHLLNHVAGTPMGNLSTMSGSLNVQPIAPDLNNLSDVGGVLGKMGYSNQQVYQF